MRENAKLVQLMTKYEGKMETQLRQKCGGGEEWRQLLEGDMEETICVDGGKKIVREETIRKKHYFLYEGR